MKNWWKNEQNRKPIKITPQTEKPHRFSAKTANRRTLSKPKKRKKRTKNREKTKNRAEKGRKPQNRKQVDPPVRDVDVNYDAQIAEVGKRLHDIEQYLRDELLAFQQLTK